MRLGSSANLAYSVANTMSSGSATTLNCFGDNNNCSTPIVNGVAVPKGAYLSMGTTTDGTNTYLTIIDWEQVLHNSVTGTKRTGPELDVYEWVPGSQCWGNGTTCPLLDTDYIQRRRQSRDAFHYRRHKLHSPSGHRRC